ncbi:MAG: 16S rRNA (cytidine(1402)-2'-O)-methyltransferase [Sphingobacteriia bacterium]|nr:16S rRNA (cytidine(1402)-2'-O)-methyltransferase [Sphingobacteriia bacterium]
MSKLYVVPTPIGNLEDITLKALRVLKEVDFILAEDTRTTSVLLRHYNISKSVVPYHQNNEHQVFERYCQRIVQGNQAALVTDAGTPAISDPGFLIVRECLKNGLSVECLPGATAFIPALVVSGLPADRFFFEGFLPHKKGRKSRIEYIRDLPYSVILYESPHRLVKTLEQLGEILGDDRHISVSRELTKVFEETTRGTVSDVLTHFNGKTIKGEFVIVIEGKKQ